MRRSERHSRYRDEVADGVTLLVQPGKHDRSQLLVTRLGIARGGRRRALTALLPRAIGDERLESEAEN